MDSAADKGAERQKQETVIVFDWDDTILPTSWLERVHAVTGGGQLRPKVQRLMADLCVAVTETLNLARSLGTVIFITNSAPGWVDQSCQHFMPQLVPEIRGIEVYAKPLSAPITFKIGVFQRECRRFENVVSVGDGDAERAASHRLMASTPNRASPGTMGGEVVASGQRVKSVKLIEFPTCQHLIAEHEMLQVRLPDVTAYQSSLDLKARFPPTGLGSPGSPTSLPKGSCCALVHFASHRAPAGIRTSASTGQLPPLNRGGGGDTFGDVFSGHGAMMPAEREGVSGNRCGPGDSGDAAPPNRAEEDGLAREPPSPGMPRSEGEQPLSAASRSLNGTPGGGTRPAVAKGLLSPNGVVGRAPGSPVRSTVTGDAGMWKAQAMGDRPSGRLCHSPGGRKKQMLSPSIAPPRGNGVWREQSVPTPARGYRTSAQFGANTV